MQQLKKGWVLWSGATFLAVEMTKSSYLSINHQPCMHHRAILSWTQRGKTTTRCLSVPIVFIISVLSVFVCEAWLFWFTEKLLDERVPQTSRTPPRSSPAALCACMDTVTHPQCLPLSAPTNRPLNFTHTSNTHTHRTTRCLPSYLLPLSVCLATTLIGQPSNPHQFLGSQSDSPEPMRCRRGRWTWESPNQIPRSDQSRILFCCMSVFFRLMTLAYFFFLLAFSPEPSTSWMRKQT